MLHSLEENVEREKKSSARTLQLFKYTHGLFVCVCEEPGFRRRTDLQEVPSLCRTLRQLPSDAQQSGKTSVHILIHLWIERFTHIWQFNNVEQKALEQARITLQSFHFEHPADAIIMWGLSTQAPSLGMNTLIPPYLLPPCWNEEFSPGVCGRPAAPGWRESPGIQTHQEHSQSDWDLKSCKVSCFISAYTVNLFTYISLQVQ